MMDEIARGVRRHAWSRQRALAATTQAPRTSHRRTPPEARTPPPRPAPRRGRDRRWRRRADAARRRRVRRCAAIAGRRGGPAAPGPQRAPASRGRAQRTARRGARRRRAPGRSGGRGSARRRARRCRRAAGATRADPLRRNAESRLLGSSTGLSPRVSHRPGSHAGAGGAAGGSGVHAGEAVEPGAPQQVEQHRLGLVVGGVPGQHRPGGRRSGRPGAGLEVGAGLHRARTPRNAPPAVGRDPHHLGLAGGPRAQPMVDMHGRGPATGLDGQNQQRQRVGPTRHGARRTSPPFEPAGSRTWPAGRRSARDPEALPPLFEVMGSAKARPRS